MRQESRRIEGAPIAQVSGQLVKVHFAVGDKVEKGELLAEILTDFPTLTEEHLRAVVAFAAASAQEEAAVTGHLTACPNCRRRLDHLPGVHHDYPLADLGHHAQIVGYK